MASRTRLRRSVAGQAIVEFTLAATAFFMLVFGVIEFGRLVWTNHELENGTREAMRYGVVHGADSGAPVAAADLEVVLLNKTSAIDNSVVVGCTNCGGEPGSTLVVSSSYAFTPFVTTLLGLDASITLTSVSEGVIHR